MAMLVLVTAVILFLAVGGWLWAGQRWRRRVRRRRARRERRLGYQRLWDAVMTRPRTRRLTMREPDR